MSSSGAILEPTPCPRCGCYLSRDFECGCGAVHDDHCVNCGRSRSLPEDQHVTLTPIADARCEIGPVMHAHPDEEKCTRIEAWYASLRNVGRG